MSTLCVQVTGDQETSSRGEQLGDTERKYYTDLCDQLFHKYTTIKAKSVEGKRSQIWKCFDLASSTSATCKLCETTVKRGPKGDTTNLTEHLQRCHSKEFDDMVETEAIKQVTSIYTVRHNHRTPYL